MERIRTGLRLVQASWDVLRADREMLVLPVLSMLASLGLSGGALHIPGVSGWITLAVLTYCPTSRSSSTWRWSVLRTNGCRAAIQRWAAQSRRPGSTRSPSRRGRLSRVVVSGIIRAIEERGGIFRRIIGGMLGLAWALITYLVLPVVVLEGLTVREAITRSKELFVKTWGETVSGEIGMGLIGFLALVVPMPVLFLLGSGGDQNRLVLAVGVAIVWVLLISVVMGALNMIFRVALYQYAADGQAPEGFEDLDLGEVFPPKRRRDSLVVRPEQGLPTRRGRPVPG